MTKETRKVRRAKERAIAPTGKEKRAAMKAPLASDAPEMPDPLGPAQMKSTLKRVGLIMGGIWIVAGLMAMISQSKAMTYGVLGVAVAITAVVIGVLIWTIRRTKSARQVAEVLRGVSTAEDREAALAKLEATTKKNDPTAIFARAQLEMQEDPKKALATLETIDLAKVPASVADEARSQRAMIHLTSGQVSLARQLVDNIELKRSQDPRSRAMIGSIMAEALARTGDAKRAQTTLELFDLNDAQLDPLKPQIFRAQAFVYAYTAKTKELRHVLRQMTKIDVRLLGGFLQGKGHPLLQKEAKRMIEQSGMVPKRMQVQRMR